MYFTVISYISLLFYLIAHSKLNIPAQLTKTAHDIIVVIISLKLEDFMVRIFLIVGLMAVLTF